MRDRSTSPASLRGAVVHAMRFRKKASLAMLALTLLFHFPAAAQSSVPAGPANLWLWEQPVPTAPLYRARIAGMASYGSFSSNATLAFACRSDGGHVAMELVIDPKALGFDADAYEGPDATSHGPLRVSVEKMPVTTLPVSGWYGDGGAFNVGTPFLFGASTGDIDAVVRQGLADSSNGKALVIDVPAPKGGTSLKATFHWPDDHAVLQRVVTPCLRHR